MVLGKLGIVIGAGIITSIVTNDMSLPRFPSVQELFSGVFKLVTKTAQKDKDKPSTTSPHTAKLLSQVNSLREELQMLSSSRPVTIVTGAAKSGSVRFRVTAIIVVGAIGFGFIRWKGWKIHDMMWVTKRGLSDACAAVGKQLEQVQSSVTAATRHLSTRIDRVDIRLDECGEITAQTKDEISILHSDLSKFQNEVESVHLFVQNLEKKIGLLGLVQDQTNTGISYLLEFSENLQTTKPEVSASDSSSRALESSKSLPVTRAGSLPPLSIEPRSSSAATSSPASPSGVMTPKVIRQSTTILGPGLKDIQNATITRSTSLITSLSESSNGASEPAEPRTDASNSRRFSWKLPSFGSFKIQGSAT